MKVPATVILRIDDAHGRLTTGTTDATLEIHVASGSETAYLDGQDVPLEIERTATLAYGLADSDRSAQRPRPKVERPTRPPPPLKVLPECPSLFAARITSPANPFGRLARRLPC